jgi:hypothetical protein
MGMKSYYVKSFKPHLMQSVETGREKRIFGGGVEFREGKCRELSLVRKKTISRDEFVMFYTKSGVPMA